MLKFYGIYVVIVDIGEVKLTFIKEAKKEIFIHAIITINITASE